MVFGQERNALKATTRSRIWTVLGALLVLGTVNWAIASKERIRREGDIIYLKLMPVDPRSLMQGDYMTLRFELAQELEQQKISNSSKTERFHEGQTLWAPITLDARQVASLSRPDETATVLDPRHLRYRIRGGRIWLGTNAFFFQEGQAKTFNNARYGEFRLDKRTGEAVLVGLSDEKLNPLGVDHKTN
jgi:uncharacterized membrane-anchored protein